MEKEIIFLVEEAPEGGYQARALGHAIFTEANTMTFVFSVAPSVSTGPGAKHK